MSIHVQAQVDLCMTQYMKICANMCKTARANTVVILGGLFKMDSCIWPVLTCLQHYLLICVQHFLIDFLILIQLILTCPVIHL